MNTHGIILGLVAIVCWASLATLGNFLIHLPSFYVLGVCFLLGSLPAWRRPREMFPSVRVSLWGILGYFSYHFFLFYSFRHAPAVEANLINYLWPMIMVLLTPIFFPACLRWYHFTGAALAVLGCVVLVAGKGMELRTENLKGHLLALGAALSWPLYSLVKKKMGEVPLRSVGGYCFGAGVLCLFTHVLIEPRVVLQWHDAKWILLMGLGPFGIAFYAWDKAMASGDTRVIGALSYLTPVLSTLGLIAFAGQILTLPTGIAMILIIGGASAGLLDFLPSQEVVK